MCVYSVAAVMSDSLRPQGLYPTRLLCLDSPDKNTGVGCHALLQGIFLTQGSKPRLLLCRQFLYCRATGKPVYVCTCVHVCAWWCDCVFVHVSLLVCIELQVWGTHL